MRISFLVVFVLATCYCSFGQTFEPGYLVTKDHDTLSGYLQEGIDTGLAHKIYFKAKEEGEVKALNPKDVHGFGFNYGRSFKSMPYEVKGKEYYIFAKQEQKGKISVFSWRRGSNNKSDMFLLNNHTGVLVHITRPEKTILTTKEGKRYSREDRDYLDLMSRVKEDTSSQEEVRYNEKKILRDIARYNEHYNSSYPVSSYKERVEKEYMILGGAAFFGESFEERKRIRAAVIQARTSIEKTRTLSFISGVFYSYRKKENIAVPDQWFWEGEINYQRQLLSLIPIGLRFQTGSGAIRPYVYAGAGLGIAKLEDHVIKYEAIVDQQTRYTFGPTLTAGAGAKIAVGSNYMLAEIAPASEGIYFNLGYTF